MQPLGAFLEVMQLWGETPVPASAMVLEEMAAVWHMHEERFV